MKIVIFGVGGVGGFFGGKLAAAGFEVTMIARGAHLEAIKNNGLTVRSITGDFTCKPYLATDDVSKIKNPDLVIFGVKSWQLQKAAKSLKPFITSKTLLLPLQNGANNVALLNEIVPKEQVIAGLCRMISFIEEPGVISNPDISPTLLLGEQDNKRTERVEKILNAFAKADITASIPENIQIAIWQKFLFITTVSAIGGLTRASIGIMRESAYILDLMHKTAQEVYRVALEKGIQLPENTIENTFRAIKRQAYETTASTQRDIMEGKPSELENFNGYIVREGEKLGIPTPINKMIYELLKPQEEIARKSL